MVFPDHDGLRFSNGIRSTRTLVPAMFLIGTVAAACSSSDGTAKNGTQLQPGAGGSVLAPGAGGVSAGAATTTTGGSVSVGTGGTPTPGSGGIRPVGSGGTLPTGTGGVVSAGGAAAGGSAGSAAGGAGGTGGAGGGSAAGGAGGAPAGGFPRNDMVNTDRMGPYKTASYTMGLDNPTYASSVMYYPTDASPPYAATVFSPGFTATKENYMNFLGPLLASHGIAILLTTPTTTGDLPQQRAEDLAAAVKQIATENTRDGSPLKGKLVPDRVCVTGHSMGGGGTMWAANTLGNMIRCAVPLQPWQPGQTFPMVKAPTLFIAAQSDTIAAPAQNASIFYDSIPAGVPKYYAEFAGASHFLTTNDLGTAYDTQSKYMVAFYKVYLEDDMRYMSVLTGPPDMALSAYKHSP